MVQQVLTIMNVARNSTYVTSVNTGQAPLLHSFTDLATLVGGIDLALELNNAKRT